MAAQEHVTHTACWDRRSSRFPAVSSLGLFSPVRHSVRAILQGMILALVLCSQPTLTPAADPSPANNTSTAAEYDVKIAFIYRMAELVLWPEGTLGPQDQPVRLGIVGDEPDAKSVQQALDGRIINGHPIVVVTVDKIDTAATCRILFITRSATLDEGKLIRLAKSSPQLSIGESDNFIDRGGMINFVTVDQKIRFEINQAAANKAGLKISSRLLGLAVRVIPTQ